MKNKKGLVLEGGGAKGSYQIGAYKALKELGFDFDYIVGTSIGSLNGALFVQRDFDLAENIWRNLKYSDFIEIEDEKFDEFVNEDLTLETLGKKVSMLTEIFSNKGLDTKPFKKLLDDCIDEEKIRNSNIKYGLVTLDVTNLKPIEIFSEDMPQGTIKDYIYASCNLLFFKQEPTKGRILLDGGFYNNNPVNMLEDKCDEIVNVILFPDRYKPEEYEGKNVISILPSEELSGIMNFNKKYVELGINLGYFDTYKKFKNLCGEKYYIKNISPEFSLSVLMKIYKKRKEKENLRRFLENAFEFLLKDEKNKSEFDYDDILIHVCEKLAQVLKIERFKIYDIKDLCKEIIAAEKISEIYKEYNFEMEIVKEIAAENL